MEEVGGAEKRGVEEVIVGGAEEKLMVEVVNPVGVGVVLAAVVDGGIEGRELPEGVEDRPAAARLALAAAVSCCCWICCWRSCSCCRRRASSARSSSSSGSFVNGGSVTVKVCFSGLHWPPH